MITERRNNMENAEKAELRMKVLKLVASMKGKKGAKSDIGRAAEAQKWKKFLMLWIKVGDVKAIDLLSKDILEEV